MTFQLMLSHVFLFVCSFMDVIYNLHYLLYLCIVINLNKNIPVVMIKNFVQQCVCVQQCV